MNWITTSFLMFISSIIYYLIVKKAQINKIESRLYMVANFSIPMVFYLIMNISQKRDLFPPLWILILMFLNSLIFGYIGSVAGYLAIEKAPNAGYSVTIQKSYAVYTSIASVFLFGSVLTSIKFLAILSIVVATAFVLMGEKIKVKKADSRWIWYSLLAFFLFGTLRLNNRMIIAQGIAPVTQLFWSMTFILLISLVDLFRSRKKITTKFSRQNITLLAAIGLSVTSFYYFLQISEVIGPNLGYVSAINTASNAFYTVLVALIFKDHLSWKKLLAVVGVTLGIIVLVV